MHFTTKIFRYHPEQDRQGRLWLNTLLDWKKACRCWRYCTRFMMSRTAHSLIVILVGGAICGTCAVMINGVAQLACKTQVSKILDEAEAITIEPLRHYGVVKDLVVDKRPLWQAVRATRPWLFREKDLPDERLIYEAHLNKLVLDQLNRSSDCIKCSCCHAGCPKVDAMPEFIGPAISIQISKQMFDPRDKNFDERKKISAAREGVFACDKHAVCVKVCPKDCRPLRAITFIQNRVR